MSTDAVTAAGLRTLEEYQKQSRTTGKSDLDMDDFLKLFIAQMANQDPLSSSSGSGSGGMDYITQMAQMTMLEQLSSLNDALSSSQAYSMIGKYAYIGGEAGSELLFGKVDGVLNEDGVNYLMIGGNTYDLSEVYGVVEGDVASDNEILQSAGLIGKTVTAKVTIDGEESSVTGVVDKVLVADGAIYVVIDDEKIALTDITEISETDAE